MEAIYRKKCTVQFGDIDFSKKVKLSSLFMYFQEIATEHAENLGVGRNYMNDHGVIWVLLRAIIEVSRYPGWNESIVIETWPAVPEKIEFDRSFIVYDSNDNVISRALTSWAIIDINNRKIKRSSHIDPDFPPTGRERAINYGSGRIKSQNDLKKTYKKTVGYSDIDMNEHVNNAKYVDYIMDCFSLEKYRNRSIRSIEVDYIHEALPGDSMILYSSISDIDDDTVYAEGVNEVSNMIVFRSQIEFK